MGNKIETLVEEVSAILLKDWDPLEVADMPDARREYDGYAAEIVSMHEAGDLSAEKLYDYLKKVTEESLNRKSETEPAARAATNIITILKQ